MALSRSSSPLGGGLLAAGLASFFVGERVLAHLPSARVGLSGVGAALVVASIASRVAAAARVTGERRRTERTLALLGVVVAIALALAFATTEAGEALVGVARLEPAKRQKFEAIAGAAWATLLLVSLVPTLFVELAAWPMRAAASYDARRVRMAGVSGATLALATAYVALFTYAAGELGVKADFSYFRTGRPGESTKNILRGLSEPVRAIAFFPQQNEVGREVDGYLRELAGISPSFTAETQDRLLAPALAKDLKVSTDGVLVVTRGKLHESVQLGTDPQTARAKLKTLDAEFQKVLLKVVREQKTAYFTVGHGELSEGASSPDGHATTALKRLLESQSYAVKELGLAQGLGREVPNDATIVLVLGPTQPLAPGEIEALRRFAERGGKLLLALDPDARVDHAPLAAAVGVAWQREPLANDRVYLQRTYSDADRAILVTNRYSSHASVSTLSRNSSRAPIILAGASALDRAPGAEAALSIDFAVRTMPDTFVDTNGDFRLDGAEKRGNFNLAAAVSKKLPAQPGEKDAPELRAFVLGDVDALSDAYLGNDPNVVLALDAIRWLGGEESYAGAVTSTEDVKIEHTKQKDVIWFYASLLGAPSAVLALGLWITRPRRRTSGRSS